MDRSINNEFIPGHSKKIRHFEPRGPRKSDVFFVFGKNLGMASLQNSLPTLINNIKQIIYVHVNL
jgi:hypothetical protein